MTIKQHRHKKMSSDLTLSPERRCSFEPWLQFWLRWRATSSVPASSRWRPWGSVWAAVTAGTGWAGGARRRTGRCHKNARGWWHADASPVRGCRPRRSLRIPLGPKQKRIRTFNLETVRQRYSYWRKRVAFYGEESNMKHFTISSLLWFYDLTFLPPSQIFQ